MTDASVRSLARFYWWGDGIPAFLTRDEARCLADKFAKTPSVMAPLARGGPLHREMSWLTRSGSTSTVAHSGDGGSAAGEPRRHEPGCAAGSAQMRRSAMTATLFATELKVSGLRMVGNQIVSDDCPGIAWIYMRPGYSREPPIRSNRPLPLPGRLVGVLATTTRRPQRRPRKTRRAREQSSLTKKHVAG